MSKEDMIFKIASECVKGLLANPENADLGPSRISYQALQVAEELVRQFLEKYRFPE